MKGNRIEETRIQKLNLDTSSKTFSLMKAGAERLQDSANRYFKKTHTEEITNYGLVKASIEYTIIRLQREAIENNVTNHRITMPSLQTISLAFNCSVQGVNKILKTILPLLTFKYGRKKGSLDYLVNPFAKVKDFITKQKQLKEAGKKFGERTQEKRTSLHNYLNRNRPKENYSGVKNISDYSEVTEDDGIPGEIDL